MKRMVLVAVTIILSGCGNGPAPLQINAQRPAYLASGLPGIRVAEAALNGGIPETALAITRGLLDVNPKDVSALVKQGEALAAMDRPDAAAESYRRAITINASAPDALLALGRLQLAAGQSEDAEILFRRVISAAPDNAKAHNDLGIALDLQGRHADAQQAYRAALHAMPELEAAQVNLRLSVTMTSQPVADPAVLETPARARATPVSGTAFGALGLATPSGSGVALLSSR